MYCMKDSVTDSGEENANMTQMFAVSVILHIQTATENYRPCGGALLQTGNDALLYAWINALEELLIAIHVNVVKCNVKCHP